MGEHKQLRQRDTSRMQINLQQMDNQRMFRNVEKQDFKMDLNSVIKMIDHQAEIRLLAACPTPAKRPTCKKSTNTTTMTLNQPRRPASSRNATALSLISFYNLYLTVLSLTSSLGLAQQVASFPGVSRDLASFCSARPSLSIDLASMVVHVKKSTSFNYKLYLFSSDNYVFQTGQIVPRDDFRIHSFPVKLKPFNEFLPIDVATLQQTNDGKLAPVVSNKFNAKAFFSQVPINPTGSTGRNRAPRSNDRPTHVRRQQRELQALKQQSRAPTFDVLDHGDVLPGDETSYAPFGHHDVALVHERNSKPSAASNLGVHFDRDDQVAVLGARSPLHDVSRREINQSPTHSASVADRISSRSSPSGEGPSLSFTANQQMVMPVGAFSSFHVNTTYLVRKDFDQRQPELVRLTIDPHKFVVTQLHLLDFSHSDNATANTNATQLDDHAFLKHKLLSDPNTRITSINQIYEDWITRNFYTIVYIQRRLETPERARVARSSREELEEAAEVMGENRRVSEQENSSSSQTLIVTDRLIFRGSSVVLLGADQLDYEVKASAFITEKNGLHYYFEFLTQGKFYLGAIDWSRRPFAIIDAQRFPLRQTKTKFDNEELLLCPPSVCYSERPVDELVSYGRLGLPEKLARQAALLTRALSGRSGPDEASKPALEVSSSTRLASANRTVDEQDHELTYISEATDKMRLQKQQQQQQQQPVDSHRVGARETDGRASEMISLDELTESVRSAASQLELRLHLRDWTWTLPRVKPKVGAIGLSTSRNNTHNMTVASISSPAFNATTGGIKETSPPMSAFAWHFEWARRNDIKVAADTYGFVLTGHEIDASYRIYDELHLISANHLITINYTLANETVTSVQPIGDEFQGLSSSLLDPITGAFYDRYSNQLYFFKGDRYVGYDYATKKPLEDFLLPPPLVDAALMVAPNASPLLQSALGGANTSPTANRRHLMQPLVSSLPVVGILGRQHYVDAIWHDLHEDSVYVFAGAKYYAFHASDFKDGAFRTTRQPAFRCINEHFLDGCRFDEAFPNPCHETDTTNYSDDDTNEVEVDPNQRQQVAGNTSAVETRRLKLVKPGAEFSEEQQMKLRSIAARGGGILDVLLENTLLGTGAGDGTRTALEPFLLRSVPMSNTGLATESTPQERIVIYLLVAMVLITILVTVAMIIVVLSWGRAQANGVLDGTDIGTEKLDDAKESETPYEHNGVRGIQERIAYPPAISQYLTNQYNHRQLDEPLPYQQQYARRQQVPLNFMGPPPAHYHTAGYNLPARRQNPPVPHQSQSRLFQSLNQMAKAAVPPPNRSPTKRYDNLVDSSAL